jgi:hypothetical protein
LNLALVTDVDFVLQDEGQKLFVCEPVGRGFLESDGQRVAQSGQSQIMEEGLELVHGSSW